MTTCLGKSYSFGLLCVRVIREHLSVCVRSSFPFGFEGGIWDLIIFFSDHCLSFALLQMYGFISMFSLTCTKGHNFRATDKRVC